ncbi:hypothetical protein AB0919_06465 [Streptomyces sp. NPDC046994]|uniref:hypothetical protein n=1 Tax=Streptomyces sp. NPDC046994 TaxID=3155735 RepID=UPI003454763E
MPECLELAPGEVFTALAPVLALTADRRYLVGAADGRTGKTADARRFGPQFGSGAVVFTAVPQFEQAEPGDRPSLTPGPPRTGDTPPDATRRTFASGLLAIVSKGAAR